MYQSLKIVFILANRVDPNEIKHSGFNIDGL